MTKPNTDFNLGLRDIDIIENALNSVLARRSSILNTITDNASSNTTDISVYRDVRREVEDLRDLLGRLHNQKNWFRPKSSVYISG